MVLLLRGHRVHEDAQRLDEAQEVERVVAFVGHDAVGCRLFGVIHFLGLGPVRLFLGLVLLVLLLAVVIFAVVIILLFLLLLLLWILVHRNAQAVAVLTLLLCVQLLPLLLLVQLHQHVAVELLGRVHACAVHEREALGVLAQRVGHAHALARGRATVDHDQRRRVLEHADTGFIALRVQRQHARQIGQLRLAAHDVAHCTLLVYTCP